MVFSNSDLIAYRLSRAEETITEARKAIDDNHLHLAENRIYYSIFYLVSALALKNLFSTSKHKQLLGWFNKTFVADNVVDKSFGKIYLKAFERRQEGDYDDMVVFEREQVEKHFSDMLIFVNEIKKLIDIENA